MKPSVAYLPWHKRFPGRFAKEREQMQARGFLLNEAALEQNGLVEFSGRSAVTPTLELKVRLPDAFPSKPPHVHASGAGIQGRRHYRPDSGEICTFGPSRGRWTANLSATTAIDEAEKVIADVSGGQSAGEKYFDDVPEPASALYYYDTPTFILVPPSIADFVTAMPEGASAPFRLKFESWPGPPVSRNAPGRGVVVEVGGSRGVKTDDWYDQLVRSSLDCKGIVIRLSEPPPLTKSLPEFNAWLASLGYEHGDWVAFVFSEQVGNARTQRLGWLFVRLKHRVEHIRGFVAGGEGRRARMPGLSDLESRKLVLIGCGSLGSKIAARLAASGVNHFGLVDFDFLEPDNAVRHELGVNLFGFPKVVALRNRLFHLNPSTFGNIKPLEIFIGGTNDLSKEAELHEMLASASIVVDTTGDHGVSRFLNDVCGELKVPQLYGSVTNGAWGGEVVRVIPGKTPCWMCWYKEYEFSRPAAEPSPEEGVFAPGCDQPTFTGTSYDIDMVAGLASSLIVDTLLIDDANRKHYEGNYIRWQMRNSGGELSPGTEVLATHRREDCRFCDGD